MLRKKEIYFFLRKQGRLLFWIFLFSFTSSVAHSLPTKTKVQVQVLSLQKPEAITVVSSQGFRIQWERADSGKKESISWPAEKSFNLSLQNNLIQFSDASLPRARRVKIIPSQLGGFFVGSDEVEKSFFHQTLTITPRQGKLQLIATVPIQSYVASVLASELPADFPLEALKAQAVLIRTQAYRATYPHHREGFDFCDTTHCQVFQTQRPVPEKMKAAVQETEGLVLTYQTKTIEALYHSTCGHQTSANQKVFGGQPLPYLQGVIDSKSESNETGKNYCADSPHSHWQSVFTLQELRKAFSKADLKNIQILDLDQDGRAEEILLQGEKSHKMLAQDFLLQIGRQQLGWHRIKSAIFDVEKKSQTFTFTGKGLGHGVGMCQWGARGMALAGKNFQAILKHYFPGTRLQHWQ